MSSDFLQSDDLAWDAFRYAAGEMSAAEASRFEERLAVEQPAREALAAAVGLAQASALAMADDPMAPPARTRRPAPQRRKWAWTALAAAACLAVLASLAAVAITSRSTQQRLASHSARQRELAVRWSEVRQLDHAAADDDQGDVTSSMLEDYAAGEADSAEADSPAAPDWMLAAVVGLREQEMTDPQRVDSPLEQ